MPEFSKLILGSIQCEKNHQFVCIVVGRYTSISRVCFYDFQHQSTVKKMEKNVSKYREQKNSSLFKQLKQFYTKRKTPKKIEKFLLKCKKKIVSVTFSDLSIIILNVESAVTTEAAALFLFTILI